MANSSRGAVPLQAGDTEYTVSFSVNALCELEDAFGVPVQQIGTLFNTPDSTSMKDVRKLVRCGLSDHHPDIDDRAAGQVASDAGLPACMEVIQKAFALAFPEAKAKPNPRAAKASAR